MRKYVTILEGPDGGGKSTLAEALGEHGWEYEHSGPPEKASLQHYLDMLRRHDGSVVLDRWHGGSYIYGLAFRHMDDLTPYERWTLEGTALAHGARLVYACPDADVINKNLERGPDNADAAVYEAPEKRDRVRELYEDFMSNVTQLPVVHYDFTVPGARNALVQELLVKRIEFDSNAMLPENIPVLGNVINPRYVFVGDEPAGRARVLQAAKRYAHGNPETFKRFCDHAFAMADYYDKVPFQGCSSGRYLHWALTVAGIPLTDYCIFNSRQLAGQDVADFLAFGTYESTAPGWAGAEVVALGNAASARLTQAGFVHRTVTHPSYWKRFHYKDVDGYAKALRGDA